MRGLLATILSLFLVSAAAGVTAYADSAKIGKEGGPSALRGHVPSKSKVCCGYPLSEERGFRFTFYWLAEQKKWTDPQREDQAIYTRDGFFLGMFNERFVRELRMEGSGVLSDGRVFNYAGKCNYGVGTCFETLDKDTHPYGRGAGRRALVPFRSVAVDRRLIPIGETLYVPELDGQIMPNGMVHDGCLRADDTGGAINRRHIDFFVVTEDNFWILLKAVLGNTRFSPQIEHPRCTYLRRG